MISLDFDRGTLLVRAPVALASSLEQAGARFDERLGCWRAPGHRYRELRKLLDPGAAPEDGNGDDSAGGRDGDPFEDRAPAYERVELRSQIEREPYPHQREAVDHWAEAGGQGVVVLPTGSGKTYVAQLIIERIQKSALVVTPTLDLVQQWYAVLSTGFGQEVGIVGGGYHEVLPITVTTYDSAWMHMEHLGNRFALLVFDECHHLPGPSYRFAAEASLAPWRLGLTATPELEEDRARVTEKLIGPVVYEKAIGELKGDYLADYHVERLPVRLSEADLERYHASREVYLAFLRERRIRIASPGGWARFLQETAKSENGRRAFLAYREQKSITQASDAKIALLERLLQAHRQDRVLVFTNDNETVYRISRKFLVPAITHQTKVKERHGLLEAFNEGRLPFLVTSKVLNEGVDVPAANVGIVLSGSGSVREHVQRLGRILRRSRDKRAKLYEVVTADTAEEYVSERRRQHDAHE